MKNIKRMLTGMLAAIIIIISLTSCTAQKAVAIIDNKKISEPLYRICLWLTQRDFESITPNIWTMDNIEGKTPEEYAKDKALNSLKLSIAAAKKAEELDITLTRDEKAEIKVTAKEQMITHEEFARAFNIKQKHFEEFLTYNKLIEKVTNQLGENYVPNEQELNSQVEEIKRSTETATVKHILIINKDEQGDPLPADKDAQAKRLAEEVLKKALNGEDFDTLIKTYSEDEAVSLNGGEYTFVRGSMSEIFEEVAFNLGEVGKVYPKVVETEFGYEIILVEERNIPEASEVESEAIKAIKVQFAQEELSEISELMKVEKLELYSEMHIINNN